MTPADFRLDDRLYRGFRADELDDDGKLDVDTLRLPDLSCNWSRFSIPHDVRFRMPGWELDGCYAITVETARYKSFATPCHDPRCNEEPENYAHVEVRELYESEPVTSTPPRNRKKKRKAMRSEWKTNIINTLERLLEPGQ